MPTPRPSRRPGRSLPAVSPRVVVDHGFIAVRAKLIEVAAFFDRVERHGAADDFRCAALRKAAKLLVDGQPGRARRILESLSDPTTRPDAVSTGKAALGAWLKPAKNNFPMRYIEPHGHMVSRTTDDYQAMVTAGCAAVCEPAFWAGYDRSSVEGFRDYFRQLTEYEPARAAKFLLPHFSWLCINPKESEDLALANDVLALIPEFIGAPNVLGIGEIGLNRNTRNELKVLEQHVDLAVKYDQLILVHTPHLEDKLKGTRLIVDLLLSHKGVKPGRVIIDHVEEHTIQHVLDQGFWAGITLYPDSKSSPPRAVDMLEICGRERIWLNSACDWGVSDPLAVPKTAFELRRRGYDAEFVDQVLYQNPVRFLSQCPKFLLPPHERRIDPWFIPRWSHGPSAMKLHHGLHLAYCTNVHRGETWEQTFGTLERHTLLVRQRVARSDQPYAIGLRLGQRAATELAQPAALAAFRRWLDAHNCYVFTINGFPYGSFHGTRVKEQVYAPDWSTPERLAYTNLLFDLIAQLVPAGVAGSVSTVPGSFKEWTANDPARRAAIFKNVTACARHIAAVSEKTGRDLHLGMEPEPCCYFETTAETVEFFNGWRASDRTVEAEGLLRRVGVNYDCCHLAVEFESPAAALDRLAAAGLRLSKIHLSSALRVKPDAAGRAALAAFVEPTYLHQVVVGQGSTVRRRYVDLPDALADATPSQSDDEWRVHFHLPLHAAPGAPFGDTRDHLLGALDWMQAHPDACQHAEMETYTWEVLPPALRLGVEDQLVKEYEWTLAALAQRGLA